MKKQPIIRTFLNARPSEGRVFTQKSKTVPDDTLSIRQILDNFSRGNTTGAYEVSGAEFDELNHYPDVKTLDLVERHELIEDLTEEKLTLGKKYKQLKQPPPVTPPVTPPKDELLG